MEIDRQQNSMAGCDAIFCLVFNIAPDRKNAKVVKTLFSPISKNEFPQVATA